MGFDDRIDAGRQLAEVLKSYEKDHPLILALPRGGVPIGYEIAQKLHSPLDVIIVRKIGVPFRREMGVGAIAEGGASFFDTHTTERLGLTDQEIEKIVSEESQELQRRIELYREGKPLPKIKNRVVIVVDDGLATGVTARAAIRAVKKYKPKEIVYAVPVCAYDTEREIARMVTTIICLTCPIDFQSVGQWYRHFQQVTDQEVIDLLKKSQQREKSHFQQQAV